MSDSSFQTVHAGNLIQLTNYRPDDFRTCWLYTSCRVGLVCPMVKG